MWGFVLLCLPVLAGAQVAPVEPVVKPNPIIDSLQALLPKVENTHKVLLYRDLCWQYRNLDLVKAIRYGKKGLALAQNLKDIRAEAEISRFIGLTYRHHFFFDESLEWYNKALELSNLIKDDVGIGFSYDNLGVTRFNQKQVEEAQKHFKKALFHFTQAKHSEGLAYAHTHLSWVMAEQKKYAQALDYAQKSLQYRKDAHANKEQICNARLDIFVAQMGLKDYVAAEKNLLETFKLAKAASVPAVAPNLLLSLGDLYLTKGDLANAAIHIKASYKVAQAFNNHLVRMKCAEHLSLIHQKQGEYEQAMRYQTQYYALKDSLFNADINNKTASLEAKYQYELKEREMQEARKRLDLENKRNLDWERFLSSVLIAAFLFMVLMAYLIGQKRKQDKVRNEELTRKNAEISRQHAEIQAQALELAENNQFKDRLFSIISHDLRSPVAGLVGALDLANEGLLSKSEFRNMLPDLTHNVNSIQSLLDNLLAWARSQMRGITPEPEAFHLYDLMTDKISFLHKQAQLKNINIQNNIEKDLQILADKNMIDLVARNLLSNAIKFSNRGGSITLSSTRYKGYSKICIADTGVGIAPEHLANLFCTQNLSTKGTAGEVGTGLGLRLSKEFIEKNGGKIWAESTLGEGSKFYFTIPE